MFKRKPIGIKKQFGSRDPKQVTVTYASKGYDMFPGSHNKYTCEGDEIDMICCDSRDSGMLIVARKPSSKKRFVGFGYNIENGQCKFYDYGMSEKEIKNMVSTMDVLTENQW